MNGEPANKAKVIAFYLPQFHAIPENDAWWGKGFTEWTNVRQAKPLFRGHYQPRVPGELGYYDLHDANVRERQAELAREAGVSAFCYWHYWYSGKQLLEMPLQEVVRLGRPDFPFCLGWANHSWEKKDWNPKVNALSKTLLVEQTYGDEAEITRHFETMLPMFRDPRYFRIRGRLAFLFFKPNDIPRAYFERFVSRWDALASSHGLGGFHWIAQVEHPDEAKLPNASRCSAFNYSPSLFVPNECRLVRALKKAVSLVFHVPLLRQDYTMATRRYVSAFGRRSDVYPTVLAGFDHSPRRGRGGIVLARCTPETFAHHVRDVLKQLEGRQDADRIVFLKSWNEWGEGNYMEPDKRYGNAFIVALRQALRT